jgi:hypothetical protein
MSNVNTDWTQAERQEVIAEALHHPETPEECAAQKAKFRAWLQDSRYQNLWPMLEKLIDSVAGTAGSPRLGGGDLG